jgi:hypothetical protein
VKASRSNVDTHLAAGNSTVRTTEGAMSMSSIPKSHDDEVAHPAHARQWKRSSQVPRIRSRRLKNTRSKKDYDDQCPSPGDPIPSWSSSASGMKWEQQPLMHQRCRTDLCFVAFMRERMPDEWKALRAVENRLAAEEFHHSHVCKWHCALMCMKELGN